MEINLKSIPVRDLIVDYKDSADEGVVGFGGRLDIRPKYQREFVYKDQQRNAVIETVNRGFPLNVLYWVDNGNDSYEVLDGQQRIISICQYCTDVFSVTDSQGKPKIFFNLGEKEKDTILDYELMVYFCKGDDKEKLDWFRTINIAGVKLSEQELRNAVYSGPWVSDAKRYFSKNGCPAHDLGDDYLSGERVRQDYLQTAIRWISKDDINEYMARHQHDEDAQELWDHFVRVIEWIRNIFPHRNKAMKGVAWGPLYDKYRDVPLNPAKLEKRVKELLKDDEVDSKKGIWPYVLSGEEKHLSLRRFSESEKETVAARQDYVCPLCGEELDESTMQADHIEPWSEGGRTVIENCQVLCQRCNATKSNK